MFMDDLMQLWILRARKQYDLKKELNPWETIKKELIARYRVQNAMDDVLEQQTAKKHYSVRELFDKILELTDKMVYYADEIHVNSLVDQGSTLNIVPDKLINRLMLESRQFDAMEKFTVANGAQCSTNKKIKLDLWFDKIPFTYEFFFGKI